LSTLLHHTQLPLFIPIPAAGRLFSAGFLISVPTALFMSGYTADLIAHHGVLDSGVKFIQKPFSMKDLSNRIREALES